MKQILLTTIIIIGLMLTMSCKACSKDKDKQYNDMVQNNNIEQNKRTDEQDKDLYDIDTGLDYTGAGTYKVKKGDTLSDISRRVYNDGFYYPVIICASRGVVTDPDKIKPGMELTIPDLEKNKANVNRRRSMKDCLNGFAEIEKARPKPDKGLIDGLKKRADAL